MRRAPWLSAPFDQPVFARALARPFRAATPFPSLVLPSALAPARARELRARVAPRLAPFLEADRGRYHHSGLAIAPGLHDEVLAFAELASGRALRLHAWHWLRFPRGGHALRADDAQRTPPPGDLWLEALLDLSPRCCPDAAVIYSRDAHTHLAVPPDPGQLALVERDRRSSRYHRYVSCLSGRACAWRLLLLLVPRPG